ncbi:hypothetical protein RN001_011196 [Aquatica leii]|uniref:Uncharacterized protein n=1 Tax=Aquatica leii TaxID=1421715 RepID=A0AAN7Q3W7_9COLE|nr:hypothetical protein RN001_011196 [Aquatica leii]
MDPLLGFDVLLYFNMYFYPTFAVSNVSMWVAKYTSPVFLTPYIGQDGCIQGVLVSSELLKLLIFRRLRQQREVPHPDPE